MNDDDDDVYHNDHHRAPQQNTASFAVTDHSPQQFHQQTPQRQQQRHHAAEVGDDGEPSPQSEQQHHQSYQQQQQHHSQQNGSFFAGDSVLETDEMATAATPDRTQGEEGSQHALGGGNGEEGEEQEEEEPVVEEEEEEIDLTPLWEGALETIVPFFRRLVIAPARAREELATRRAQREQAAINSERGELAADATLRIQGWWRMIRIQKISRVVATQQERLEACWAREEEELAYKPPLPDVAQKCAMVLTRFFRWIATNNRARREFDAHQCHLVEKGLLLTSLYLGSSSNSTTASQGYRSLESFSKFSSGGGIGLRSNSGSSSSSSAPTHHQHHDDNLQLWLAHTHKYWTSSLRSCQKLWRQQVLKVYMTKAWEIRKQTVVRGEEEELAARMGMGFASLEGLEALMRDFFIDAHVIDHGELAEVEKIERRFAKERETLVMEEQRERQSSLTQPFQDVVDALFHFYVGITTAQESQGRHKIQSVAFSELLSIGRVIEGGTFTHHKNVLLRKSHQLLIRVEVLNEFFLHCDDDEEHENHRHATHKKLRDKKKKKKERPTSPRFTAFKSSTSPEPAEDASFDDDDDDVSASSSCDSLEEERRRRGQQHQQQQHKPHEQQRRLLCERSDEAMLRIIAQEENERASFEDKMNRKILRYFTEMQPLWDAVRDRNRKLRMVLLQKLLEQPSVDTSVKRYVRTPTTPRPPSVCGITAALSSKFNQASSSSQSRCSSSRPNTATSSRGGGGGRSSSLASNNRRHPTIPTTGNNSRPTSARQSRQSATYEQSSTMPSSPRYQQYPKLSEGFGELGYVSDRGDGVGGGDAASAVKIYCPQPPPQSPGRLRQTTPIKSKKEIVARYQRKTKW